MLKWQLKRYENTLFKFCHLNVCFVENLFKTSWLLLHDIRVFYREIIIENNILDKLSCYKNNMTTKDGLLWWLYFTLKMTNADKSLTTLWQLSALPSFALALAGSYHLQGRSCSESDPKLRTCQLNANQLQHW